MRKKFSCSLRARPNKKCVFWVMGLKILGRVVIHTSFFFPGFFYAF